MYRLVPQKLSDSVQIINSSEPLPTSARISRITYYTTYSYRPVPEDAVISMSEQ